jgi:hypothetical protein
MVFGFFGHPVYIVPSKAQYNKFQYHAFLFNLIDKNKNKKYILLVYMNKSS